MKVIIVHDAQGNISSIGAPSPQRSGVGLKPKPGQQVSIIDLAEIEHPGHLAKYVTGHFVDTRSGHPKLVKK